MTTRRLLALLLVVMAVTVAVARSRAGRDLPGTRAYPVTGVVTAAPADGRVMVAHDEIPGYMAAMTMPFAIDPAAPPPVRPGDRVRFTLRVADAWSRAEDFEVVGHDAAVAAALAGPGTPAATRRLKPGDTLPAFTLTRETGEPFTTAALQGRRSVITFIFTRCPVPEFCPLMVKRFQQIQRAAKADSSLADVQLVSVTLDPAFDTPPVLTAYARAMQADPARWPFVTGTPDAIAALTRAFAVHVEKNGVLLDHTLATAVVGPDGRLVEMWRGNQWSAEDVLEVLRRGPKNTEQFTVQSSQ